MLRFQWTLPKALRWVLSQVPGAMEEEGFQEELLALAKVNELLVRDESVDELLQEGEAPAAELWRLAGGSRSIDDRKKIVEVIRSLCPEDVETTDMDADLQELEDSRGRIGWHQFKRWFMLGQRKAG